MDALSETLRVVRLVGAIFINARFTAPWCYQSPSADSAAPLLEPGAERVVIFHLITEGECYVELGDEPPVRLTAGDVIVFPKGHAHRMTSQPGLPPATGARLDQVLARRPRQLVYGGGGATTRLVCGYLACDARLAGILLAGLPALLRVNVRGSNAGIWLEASIRYALAEARSPRPGGNIRSSAPPSAAGIARRPAGPGRHGPPVRAGPTGSWPRPFAKKIPLHRQLTDFLIKRAHQRLVRTHAIARAGGASGE